MSAAPLLNKEYEGQAPRQQAMTSSQPSFACEIVSAPCICRDELLWRAYAGLLSSTLAAVLAARSASRIRSPAPLRPSSATWFGCGGGVSDCLRRHCGDWASPSARSPTPLAHASLVLQPLPVGQNRIYESYQSCIGNCLGCLGGALPCAGR